MAYFRIKHECLRCGSCFIICTLYPERVHVDTVTCPECGVSEGAFLAYQEISPGDLEDEVPGETKLSAIGKNIEVNRSETSPFCDMHLKTDFRKKVDGPDALL